MKLECSEAMSNNGLKRRNELREDDIYIVGANITNANGATLRQFADRSNFFPCRPLHCWLSSGDLNENSLMVCNNSNYKQRASTALISVGITDKRFHSIPSSSIVRQPIESWLVNQNGDNFICNKFWFRQFV